MKKIFLFSVVLFFLCGCEFFSPRRPEPPPPSRPQTRGPVLARVNDWAIGTEDFRDQIEATKTVAPEVDLDSRESRRDFLRRLVDLEILAQEAERRGVGEDRQIEAAVRNFRRDLVVQKFFEELAAETRVT